MRVWKVRIRGRKNGVDGTSSPVVDLGFIAKRSTALSAAERSKTLPPAQWTTQAVFGWYVASYERRYRRTWPYTTDGGAEIVRDIGLLVERVGNAEAITAITLAFREKWMERHHDVLARPDLYARFIIPRLDKEAARVEAGEQSEWRGGREFKARKVDPNEFFGDGQ